MDIGQTLPLSVNKIVNQTICDMEKLQRAHQT